MMEFLKALESKTTSSKDEDDAPSTSTEYHTVTEGNDDDNEDNTDYGDDYYDDDDDDNNDDNVDPTANSHTSYDSMSIDLSIDLNDEDRVLPANAANNDDENNTKTEQETTTTGKLSYECKICIRQYHTLQECLRHELLEHTNGQKSPQKNVRNSLSRLLPVFKQTNQQADRKRIHDIFQNCRPGMELHELFQIYCIADEKVRQITSAVRTCLLKDLWPSQYVEVYTFGSCENGLMTWDSDIDMYVTIKHPVQRQQHRLVYRMYNRVNSQLRSGQYFDEIVTIRRARVPIIKCRHKATGMRIDINCSCPNSVVNTAFLRELVRFDVRISSFMRFMKVWAKHMWIVGRNRMTSYCLCILVLFYLQQPRSKGRQPLVPPIRKLQSSITPYYVQGVNYAFDLYRHIHPLPADLSGSELIRGFFEFYRNFDFFRQMIAPYLGVTVPLDDFRSGNYTYSAYAKQMNSMKLAARQNEEIENLNAERVMVVQDPFQLNQNVARSIIITQLEYFRKCIEYGYHICIDSNIRTDGQLYEALLFDVIGNMENEARELRTSTGQNTQMTQPHEMLYKFSACRAEIRALTAQQLNANLNAVSNANANANVAKNAIVQVKPIYNLWARHYIEAIYIILTHVYFLDIKILTDNDDPYDERFMQRNTNHDVNDEPAESYSRENIINSLKEFDEKNEVIWIINGCIDTWSDRLFQKENSQTFMSIQCMQTKKFLNERKGKKSYVVDLLGRFTLKTIDSGNMIEIVLKQHQQTRQWFCKKDPMRRFFTNFKCCLQNFNLKEKLQEESGRRYGGVPSKSGEAFVWQGIACEAMTPLNSTLNIEDEIK